MPAVFDRRGVCFEFPENWNVEESEAGGGGFAVTVTSPGTAFWSLNLFPRTVRPAELIAEVLSMMREEYPALEFDETADEIESQPMIGYDLNFFYLDLCSTATVRGFELGGETYLLLCQAEDHELAKVEPVFRAITTSMLRAAQSRSN